MSEEDDDLFADFKEIKKMLEIESQKTVDLVDHILRSLNADNIINFFDIVSDDKKDKNQWKKRDIGKMTSQLYDAGIICDKKLVDELKDVSEVSSYMIISALERMSEHLENFTEKVIRIFWRTENLFCDKCGAENTSDNIYCSKCGNKLGNDSWDAEISRMSTEITEKLMERISGKLYYIESDKDMLLLYGVYYIYGADERDIKYLMASLRSAGIKISMLQDRIYFEKKTPDTNGFKKHTRTIRGIADELGFQEIDKNDLNSEING